MLILGPLGIRVTGYVLRLGSDLPSRAPGIPKSLSTTLGARLGLLHHGSAPARPPRAYGLGSVISTREQVYILPPSSSPLVCFPIPSSSIKLAPLLSKHLQDFSGEVLILPPPRPSSPSLLQ